MRGSHRHARRGGETELLERSNKVEMEKETDLASRRRGAGRLGVSRSREGPGNWGWTGHGDRDHCSQLRER